VLYRIHLNTSTLLPVKLPRERVYVRPCCAVVVQPRCNVSRIALTAASMTIRKGRWCVFCGNACGLRRGDGKVVRQQKVGLGVAYWVGLPDNNGVKLNARNVALPVNEHKKDELNEEEGQVGWTCSVYQREQNSDCHRGRQRLPTAAAELDSLHAEGGDWLRSETLTTTYAAHEVASNALVWPRYFA